MATKARENRKGSATDWAESALNESPLPMRKKVIVAERLAAIATKHGGRITAELVIQDATDPKSPLHDLFPWDDKYAAHEHRLHIARGIIANVQIEVRTEKETIKVPAYLRDPAKPSGEQGYIQVAKIKTEKELSRDALLYEFRRAIALLERACGIADALGLGEEVAQLIQRVQVIQSRLRAAA